MGGQTNNKLFYIYAHEKHVVIYLWSMEEILPLIIGILWLAYTFYTKGQKKKSGSSNSESDNKSQRKPSFLEQLLAPGGIKLENEEDFDFLDDPEIILEEKPDPLADRFKIKGRQPFLQSELSTYRGEGQSQFVDSFEIDMDDDFEEEQFPSELELQLKDFSLRKAIVYSAILEAPYIEYK